MTLPGLSGSFILILLGNYVLLLVDSVNALYDTLAQIAVWDFSFLQNDEQMRLIQVLLVFTAGSLSGLVILFNRLGYILKQSKSATFAVIIGFITGSLGVVWPWKEAIYRKNMEGMLVLDKNGHRIIDNYDRYLPTFSDHQTWIAISFIIIGALIVLWLAWYENRNKLADA
mgnify:CR=1 FL=1